MAVVASARTPAGVTASAGELPVCLARAVADTWAELVATRRVAQHVGWSMLRSAWWGEDPVEDTPADGWPVALVHGLGADGRCWGPFEEALADRGFTTFAVDYRTWGRSFGDATAEVERELAALARRYPNGFGVVAHSLGGVLVRRALSTSPDLARVVRVVVTLGSPHSGAPLSATPGSGLVPGLGRCIARLRPRSVDFGDAARGPVWVSVGGGRDVLVPDRYSRLPGATHRRFGRLGHLGLLVDQSVHAFVSTVLTEHR